MVYGHSPTRHFRQGKAVQTLLMQLFMRFEVPLRVFGYSSCSLHIVTANCPVSHVFKIFSQLQLRNQLEETLFWSREWGRPSWRPAPGEANTFYYKYNQYVACSLQEHSWPYGTVRRRVGPTFGILIAYTILFSFCLNLLVSSLLAL